MFEQIWQLLSRSDSLLDEAWKDAMGMLSKSELMYEMVIRAVREPPDGPIRSEVAAMDRGLNDVQRDVRKKVFEHLVMSRGSDLLRGLQLTAIVIDLERIGDYTKNIAELTHMMKGPMDFGEFSDRFEELHGLVTQMFRLTLQALSDGSADKAKGVMDLYPRASRLCDDTMREVLAESEDQASDGCSIERIHLGLVLLLRYLKRVAAHLKNVASALVNPFHQIGFRDGLT